MTDEREADSGERKYTSVVKLLTHTALIRRVDDSYVYQRGSCSVVVCSNDWICRLKKLSPSDLAEISKPHIYLLNFSKLGIVHVGVYV